MIIQIHPSLTCKPDCGTPNHYPDYHRLGPGLYIHTCNKCGAQSLIHVRIDKMHFAVFTNYQDIEPNGQWLQSPNRP